MTKLKTKLVKDSSTTLKMVGRNKQVLVELAENNGITLSDLINQLVEVGYSSMTKKDLNTTKVKSKEWLETQKKKDEAAALKKLKK